MKIQNSFKNDCAKLYLISTPIGNLEDITFRAVKTLKEVDVIFAEDTRVSGKLLKHFEIKKPLKSYHDHNEEYSSDKIIEHLRDGDSVGLVSDAGMPCISDPGYEVVKKAISLGFDVVPLPGANASLTALIASGLIPQPFLFYGFLDRSSNRRKKQLEKLSDIAETLIFYESPHRIDKTLKDILDILGNKEVVIAREITKKYEQFIRGKVLDIIVDELEYKGEIVLIVENNSDEKDKWWENITIKEHIDKYISDGLDSKDAIKSVAKERKVSKNEVYKIYHNILI